MAYKYKKEFFRDWYIKMKGKVKKEDLKRVLRTSSANNIQLWLLEKDPPPLKEGQTDTGDRDWLPLRCILHLCNEYGLKISDFIEDADEPGKPKRRTESREQRQLESRTLDAIREAYQIALQSKNDEISTLRQLINRQEHIISTQQAEIISLQHSDEAEIDRIVNESLTTGYDKIKL